MKQRTIISLITILFLGCGVAMSQSTRVYSSVEQMPRFPGGESALMKFLNSHIQYPQQAINDNIQGRVVVQFVVQKDGGIGEVKVTRSVDKALDAEAIRVCKSLPKFTPGRQDGEAVAVWYTLPVTFKLPDNYTKSSYGETRGAADVVIPVERTFKQGFAPSESRASNEKVFRSVEQMPQFPGGETALMKYISLHINYPQEAVENDIQGIVTVQFVVEKDGSIGEIKVVRSLEKSLDTEAVRVCKSLPKFTPGRQNGEAVAVWYTLPVKFMNPNYNK